MKYLLVVIYTFFSLIPFSYAEEGHDHKHEEKKVDAQSDEEKKSDEEHGHEHIENEDDTQTKHEEHDGHDDHEGHSDEPGGEHSEENSQVGADKGILEASEEKGIKLSPEAEKNFGIEKVAVNNSQPITISKKTIVTSGVEVNIYRYRDGFYKRIDFAQIGKNDSTFTISSKDLAKGDYIVTKGLGFILVAEIAAFGGAPEGHSH